MSLDLDQGSDGCLGPMAGRGRVRYGRAWTALVTLVTRAQGFGEGGQAGGALRMTTSARASVWHAGLSEDN